MQIAAMLDEASVEAGLVVHQLKLMKLADRFELGERSSLLGISRVRRRIDLPDGRGSRGAAAAD
jgi:hypothetical protein